MGEVWTEAYVQDGGPPGSWGTNVASYGGGAWSRIRGRLRRRGLKVTGLLRIAGGCTENVSTGPTHGPDPVCCLRRTSSIAGLRCVNGCIRLVSGNVVTTRVLFEAVGC